MAKPCCETGDSEQAPKWKVWMKRAFYLLPAVINLIPYMESNNELE